MSNKMTLDSLREAIEAKYSSFPIELDGGTTVVLRNTLRMTKPERDALSAELDKLRTKPAPDETDEDAPAAQVVEGPSEEEILGNVIRILVGDAERGNAERLLELFPDVASRSFIVHEGLPQAGEASGSQS